MKTSVLKMTDEEFLERWARDARRELEARLAQRTVCVLRRPPRRRRGARRGK